MPVFDSYYPPIPWIRTSYRRTRPTGWEAQGCWREYSANGYSRFRMLARLKAVYNTILYRLIGTHLRWRGQPTRIERLYSNVWWN